MDKILKVLACIYGIMGTIGNILISLALGQTAVSTATGIITKTNWGTFLLSLILLELSVAAVCAVLMAIVRLIDNSDELLFYAHKQDNPEAYTAGNNTNK